MRGIVTAVAHQALNSQFCIADILKNKFAWAVMGLSLFATASGPVLVPTQLPIQWARGVGLFILGVKRPGRKAGHSTSF